MANTTRVALAQPLRDAREVVLVPAGQDPDVLAREHVLLADHTAAKRPCRCLLRAPSLQRLDGGRVEVFRLHDPANRLPKPQQRVIAHGADVHAAQEVLQSLGLVDEGDEPQQLVQVLLQGRYAPRQEALILLAEPQRPRRGPRRQPRQPPALLGAAEAQLEFRVQRVDLAKAPPQRPRGVAPRNCEHEVDNVIPAADLKTIHCDPVCRPILTLTSATGSHRRRRRHRLAHKPGRSRRRHRRRRLRSRHRRRRRLVTSALPHGETHQASCASLHRHTLQKIRLQDLVEEQGRTKALQAESHADL
mmetsp:Transcript_161427/g.518353  ORF Transcript_161427/g.518353 Transcript_161427/m.518353 type:complete len:304 (-) Transcript_161427:88-999(-)